MSNEPTPDLTHETVNGELVVFDPASEQVHLLNDEAAQDYLAMDVPSRRRFLQTTAVIGGAAVATMVLPTLSAAASTVQPLQTNVTPGFTSAGYPGGLGQLLHLTPGTVITGFAFSTELPSQYPFGPPTGGPVTYEIQNLLDIAGPDKSAVSVPGTGLISPAGPYSRGYSVTGLHYVVPADGIVTILVRAAPGDVVTIDQGFGDGGWSWENFGHYDPPQYNQIYTVYGIPATSGRSALRRTSSTSQVIAQSTPGSTPPPGTAGVKSK